MRDHRDAVYRYGMTDSSLAPQNSLSASVSKLTERQEAFAQHYAEKFDASAAYRHAYSVAGMSAGAINTEAYRLTLNPDIYRRVQFYRDVIGRQVFANAAVTIQRLLEIETEIALADPNDLIEHFTVPCRRCWGDDHRYQWIEIEYIEAMENWERLQPKIRALTPMPDIAGGFGYDGKSKPHPECPHCLGKGEGRTAIKDTRFLPPGARRLFAGIKHTRNGVEVLMQDQNAARERIGRMLGAFKDTLRLTGGIGILSAQLPVDPIEAEREYRRMIQGEG